MIRIVIFLIIVGLIAFGAAWLADHPGEFMLTWQGVHIETTRMDIVAVVVLAIMAAVIALWTVLRLMMRSPSTVRAHLHRRRGERAYQAISHGLIAIGAGDLEAAHRHAAEAKRLAPAEPLALLLHAQHAQLAGDRDAAGRAFHVMAGRADTKALGLHGLFVEARRRGDFASAHAFAEEAAREQPSLGWAGRAVLEFRCLTGDWAGALALLERNKRAMPKDSYHRQRAVLLTARAMAAENSDRDAAKADALEAAKLAPTLVPAATLAGRMLAEAGELRKAARIIHKAWDAHPHPDLAGVFANLRFGDAARDRLKRIETLATKVPDHIESALAVARAALEAQEFARARAALSAFLETPTRRVALLMAELERAESNNEGRAREWIARALHAAPDPTWTADGHTSERWLPVSPSGKLDAFEWRVPVTGIAPPAAAIEPQQPISALPGDDAKSETPAPAKPENLETPAASPAIGAAPVARAEAAPLKTDAVIPLLHAPDDPGPDAEPAEDDEPHAAAEDNGSWRRIFG